MSAFALDEFSLEMRRHYIVTTIESLNRAETQDDFWGEMKELIPDWVVEGRSNEMGFFVQLLEKIQHGRDEGNFTESSAIPKISKTLKEYLGVLGTQADSEVYLKKFSENLESVSGPALQLFLQCRREKHHFIVPVANVIEIVGNKKIFPLPKIQSGVLGLVSFRGQGIPVINLHDFGFSTEAHKGSEEKLTFVVCTQENNFFALEVHSTDEVLELHPSQFQSCSDSAVLSPVVDKFVNHNDKSLMLLDIKKLVKHE